MNKTRQRAIQKHRAKQAKFEIRRKNGGEQSVPRTRSAAATHTSSTATATATPAAPAKAKTTTKRREATEAQEE